MGTTRCFTYNAPEPSKVRWGGEVKNMLIYHNQIVGSLNNISGQYYLEHIWDPLLDGVCS